jgi:hypothetical protein
MMSKFGTPESGGKNHCVVKRNTIRVEDNEPDSCLDHLCILYFCDDTR